MGSFFIRTVPCLLGCWRGTRSGNPGIDDSNEYLAAFDHPQLAPRPFFYRIGTALQVTHLRIQRSIALPRLIVESFFAFRVSG